MSSSEDGDPPKTKARPARDARPMVRNDPLVAAFWITISMALFAVLATASRKAALMGLHPFQVLFLRNVSATLFLLPLLVWRGSVLFRSNAIHLYAVRVGVSMLSMMAWFYALALVPVGEVMAIGFLAPLFGTVGAIIFLGEKVRLRRWTALILGFIGAMIILRPGSSTLGLGQLMALFSTMTGGLIAVLLKQLSSEDDPDKIVFLTTIMLLPLSAVPALFVWQTPAIEHLPVITVIGLTAVLGHVCLMRGFAAAEASLVLTFEFSRLPFAVLIGWWMFGELTDVWTWVGAAIIFASAVYITRREARLRSEARVERISKP